MGVKMVIVVTDGKEQVGQDIEADYHELLTKTARVQEALPKGWRAYADCVFVVD
jgi:hypothetical protein